MPDPAVVLPPNIQTAFLFFLARVGESGCFDVGLCADQLARLSRLTAVEADSLGHLVRESAPLLQVAVDPASLGAVLDRIDAQRDEKNMRDEFILRGASAAMMMDLFRMGLKELIARRRALGVEAKNGRPKLLDEDTQIRIYKTWTAAQNTPERRRYLDLHDQFQDVPLAVLWAVNQRAV